MTPRLTHGSDWSGQSLAGYWASEKLDGWRALWTGTHLVTRQGQLYDAPAWFKYGLPDHPLDGELWAGPGTNHDQVNAAVHGNWETLQYRPFDIPEPRLTYEAAQARLRTLSLPDHARPVLAIRIASTREALTLMHKVVSRGGEGLMLRAPGTRYAGCRTMDLLKLKPAIALAVQKTQRPPTLRTALSALFGLSGHLSVGA